MTKKNSKQDNNKNASKTTKPSAKSRQQPKKVAKNCNSNPPAKQKVKKIRKNTTRKVSKEKETIIKKLLIVLGLVQDKKQNKQDKYKDYNVGQLRPVNNRETRGHIGYTITKTGENENAKFGYVSLTHSESVNNIKTIKMNKNPNVKDSKDSFAVNKAKEAKAIEFGRQQEGWRLSKKDKKLLRKIYRDNKKNSRNKPTK